MGKLTKTAVDRLEANSGEAVLWDSETRGLGVRALPSGTKSFILKYRNRNGRSRYVTLGRYGPVTVDQARKIAMARLAEVFQGNDPADERQAERRAITVSALCAEYMAEAEKGTILTRFGQPKKARTIGMDYGRIERHIKPLLGNRAVKDLTSADIRKFIADVTKGKTAADVKTGKHGRAIVEGGKGTATRAAGLLGGILTYAVETGVIDRNPAHGVRKPAYEQRERRLTAKEYAALGKALREAEGAELWQVVAIVKALALTGARLSEIVAFKRSELDIEGLAMRLGDSKTGKSIRPIGEPALSLFKRAAELHKQSYLFPSVRKERGHYSGDPMERIVTREPALAGITAHVLRHSFISEADDLGFTEATVGAIVGHKSGTITGRYTHKVDSVLIAAADRIAAHIETLMEGRADD